MFITNLVWGIKLAPFKERVNQLKARVYLQNLLIKNFVFNDNAQRKLSIDISLFGEGPRSLGSNLHGITSYLDSELHELSNSLHKGKVSDLRNFLHILVGKKISDEKDSKEGDSITAYHDLFKLLSRKYENGAREIVGTPFQDSILELIINKNCTFIEKCANVDYDQIGKSVKDEFQDYAINMRNIYGFDLEKTMKEYINLLQELRKKVANPKKAFGLSLSFNRSVPPLSQFTPIKKRAIANLNEERRQEVEYNKSGLKRAIAMQKDWKNLDKLIANYHKDTRSLKDAELLSFGVIPPGRIILTPKTRRKKIDLDELIGYEKEKKLLIQNTEKLLSGKEANNVFITGPPGTGKSSIINALLTKYSKKGLRVLEIPKEAAPYLTHVFDEIEARSDYKFIVLIDEFEVGKDEELYSTLKTVIEGSFDGLPVNARLYVISNSENSMRTGFKPEDDKDEKYRALEDRFGLHVKFPLPDESLQKQIMQYYLGKKKSSKSELSKALPAFSEYCTNRNIKRPNPRNIRDFVKTVT